MRNLVRRYITQVQTIKINKKQRNSKQIKTKKLKRGNHAQFGQEIHYAGTQNKMNKKYRILFVLLFLMQKQRIAENEGVTEDDVNEIKNDISAFRLSFSFWSELIHLSFFIATFLMAEKISTNSNFQI